ncbi:MAG TPA: YihA family ribosome biogenesis GTP-binding protein, partial [Pseudomonadales bacterium]|nr:YihA family ribosome biogenesis GTP-binding protein [Pseudomonadales bacterium]
AKVSQEMKEEWQQHLENYLRARETLRGLVLLMDIRHPLKDFDINMLDWAESTELPVHCVLTKADKLNRGPAQQALLQVRKQLSARSVPVSVQLFSAPSKQGVDELAATLGHWLAL